MHRMIMDTPNELVCDHINHDGLDNRRKNLRNCTRQQNSFNISAMRDSSVPLKGVSFNKKTKKYVGRICVDGKSVHLGTFDEAAGAGRAYDEAAKKWHGEFANLNFG